MNKVENTQVVKGNFPVSPPSPIQLSFWPDLYPALHFSIQVPFYQCMFFSLVRMWLDLGFSSTLVELHYHLTTLEPIRERLYFIFEYNVL